MNRLNSRCGMFLTSAMISPHRPLHPRHHPHHSRPAGPPSKEDRGACSRCRGPTRRTPGSSEGHATREASREAASERGSPRAGHVDAGAPDHAHVHAEVALVDVDAAHLDLVGGGLDAALPVAEREIGRELLLHALQPLADVELERGAGLIADAGRRSARRRAGPGKLEVSSVGTRSGHAQLVVDDGRVARHVEVAVEVEIDAVLLRSGPPRVELEDDLVPGGVDLGVGEVELRKVLGEDELCRR